MSSLRIRLVLAGIAAFSANLCLAAAAPATSTPATAPATPRSMFGGILPTSMTDWKEEVLRMSEFFDTLLPGTIPHSNIVIDFAPKFSDLRDKEYIRFPITLRYGLGDRWELVGGLSPHSPNPINSGADHRWGLGEGRFGVRYDVGALRPFYDAVTVGIEARTPLGKPPIAINDRYTHIRPGFTTARALPIPHTSFYTDVSYDRQYGSRPPVPGVIRRHVTEVAPGLLYKPGEFGAFIDYRFRHFDEAGNPHNGHEYKLGPIWDIPIARTSDWGLPGKWQVEVAYRSTTEEGRPSSNGVTARVHWKTTLKEILRQTP